MPDRELAACFLPGVQRPRQLGQRAHGVPLHRLHRVGQKLRRGILRLKLRLDHRQDGSHGYALRDWNTAQAAGTKVHV